MKKLIVSLLLLCTILLSACGKTADAESAPVESTPAPTLAPTDTPAPTATPVVNAERCEPFDSLPESFSEEETEAMSSFMNMNRYLERENRLYGMLFAKDGMPSLACGEFEPDGKNGINWIEATQLEADCEADYLCLWSNRLFFRKTTEDGVSIVAMHPAGGARETLYDGECDFLQMHDGVLYFTDEVHRLCSLSTDGGEVNILIGDAEVYYPYIIAEDWLIYQNDSDGERLHLRCLSKGADVAVSVGPAFHPVISDHYLFATTILSDGTEHLARLNLRLLGIQKNGDTYELTSAPWSYAQGACKSDFAIAGGTLYGCSENSLPLESWYELEDDGTMLSCIQYVSGDYAVRYDYSEEGSITGCWFLLTSSGIGKALPNL